MVSNVSFGIDQKSVGVAGSLLQTLEGLAIANKIYWKIHADSIIPLLSVRKTFMIFCLSSLVCPSAFVHFDAVKVYQDRAGFSN